MTVISRISGCLHAFVYWRLYVPWGIVVLSITHRTTLEFVLQVRVLFHPEEVIKVKVKLIWFEVKAFWKDKDNVFEVEDNE